jgi:hypothetical protein
MSKGTVGSLCEPRTLPALREERAVAEAVREVKEVPKREDGERPARSASPVRPPFCGEDVGRASAVRGTCPLCGEDVVSNLYLCEGNGCLLLWECRASLGPNPSCDYRRVL